MSLPNLSAGSGGRGDRGSKATVEVSARLRPWNGPEPSKIAVGVANGRDGASVVTIADSDGKGSNSEFRYLARVVLGDDQTACFEALGEKLLTKLKSGYSCTLLAYGQTGSGKTHTMFGPPGCLSESELSGAGSGGVPARWGVFPRVALSLLRDPDVLTIHCSAIEVYQDRAYDLMAGGALLQMQTSRRSDAVRVVGGKASTLHAPGSGAASAYNVEVNRMSTARDRSHPPSCRCGRCWAAREKAKAERLKAIREAPRTAAAAARPAKRRASTSLVDGGCGGGEAMAMATVGERLEHVQEPGDVARLARHVEASRTSHGHALNARSSRSHCLVRMHITVRLGDHGGRVRRQQFLFVDLAGSERVTKTQVLGQRRAEALQINASLTTLGRVIQALGEGRAHVPYRDATLTKLLHASFGGESYTQVVINVSSDPAQTEESVCSLRFGARMTKVKNRLQVATTTDAGSGRAEIEQALHAVRTRLRELKAAGQGGRFGPNSTPSEERTFRLNMQRHDDANAEVSRLRNELAESKGRGAPNVSALEARIQAAEFEASNLHHIILRQRSIKGFWLDPSPAVIQLERDESSLVARLQLASVPVGGARPPNRVVVTDAGHAAR